MNASTVAGITNSADCLGYCVMTGLLWPNRAGQYLLLASTKYSGKNPTILFLFDSSQQNVHSKLGDVFLTRTALNSISSVTLVSTQGVNEPLVNASIAERTYCELGKTCACVSFTPCMQQGP